MSNVKLFDNNYQRNSKQLLRYFQLGKNTLSVAYFDSTAKRYIGLESYSLGENENWFSASKSLRKVFDSLSIDSAQNFIRINFVDFQYTLIPKAIFDKTKLETYLKFNYPIDDISLFSLKADIIESLQLAIIYTIPKEICSLVENHPNSIKWNHHSKSLLEAASLRNTKNKLFQIHILDGYFDVLLIEKNELKFFNSFPYNNVDDFIYYLLYVMDQLKLDREIDPIELVGEFEAKSALFEMLYKYIRHLNIGVRPKSVSFSNILSEIPQHYYYNLFNQHLCE